MAKTGTSEEQLRCRFVNNVATDLSSMSRLMTDVGPVGIEPTTCGLKVRSSTN